MRLGRSRALESLAMVVRKRSTAYDIERPSEAMDGRFGETDATTTTVSGVDMWLHEPEEINRDTDYGDRLGGDLQGLAQPSADIQVHDRVTHGTETYEVERIMHLPDNDRRTLKAFALQRRVNN